MSEQAWAADQFEQHRPHLRAVAYRVAVFHSPAAQLLPHQADLPFPSLTRSL